MYDNFIVIFFASFHFVSFESYEQIFEFLLFFDKWRFFWEYRTAGNALEVIFFLVNLAYSP